MVRPAFPPINPSPPTLPTYLHPTNKHRWNAAVENQAFDRVHRLGQHKEVLVRRLNVSGTVEQRILALQRKKLMLADAAMGEGVARVGKLTMKELMGLFVSFLSLQRRVVIGWEWVER